MNPLKRYYWSWRSDPLGINRIRRAVKQGSPTRRFLHARRLMLTGKTNSGWCPICEKKTKFLVEGTWLRDNYRCHRCRSIPRFRHITHILAELFPNYRELSIHESSASGPVYEKLKNECCNYVASQFWSHLKPGAVNGDFISENLEGLSFSDNSLDIHITQDVMEHVLNPIAAFSEIARTLKPGGAHIFTVPWYPEKRTFVRATPSDSGVIYHAPKDFHGNPIDPAGSLVVTEWGFDLADFIYQHGGLYTTVHITRDRNLGLDGELLQVFVSRKPL